MKKILVVLLSIIIVLNMSVIALENSQISTYTSLGLSNDSLEFLNEKKVNMSIFDDVMGKSIHLYSNKDKGIYYNRSYERIVQSVKSEAKAYNFSDEQIEQLINSAIHTPITFVVPEQTNISTRCLLPESNRIGDDGIGYEVLSLSGFHTTTAFAKLPTVYTGSDGDGSDVNAFMFWTINEVLDIGITYSMGINGEKWRICWLYAGGEQQVPTGDQDIARLQEVSELYFRTTVVDNQWIQMEIINANDFSETIKAFSVYTSGLGITRNNAAWRRQITLCTNEKDINDNIVLDGGASLNGAEFWDCYIYSGEGSTGLYDRIDEDYVNETYCGRFGLDDISINYVEVESHTDWDSEKINIQFPQ